MTGLPRALESRSLVAAFAALAVVLMIAIGLVVAFVRNGDDRTAPVSASATMSAYETSTESPRMSKLVPPSSAPEISGLLEVSGPACDAQVITSDLSYPDSGARIIDCRSGWAVMASGLSGDPYWVAYSDGRWRRVTDVSVYLGSCPDAAIARGAPAWMAEKHLGDCAQHKPGDSIRATSPGTPAGAHPRTLPRNPLRNPPIISLPTPPVLIAPTSAPLAARTSTRTPTLTPTLASTPTPSDLSASSAVTSAPTSVSTATSSPTSVEPAPAPAEDVAPR